MELRLTLSKSAQVTKQTEEKCLNSKFIEQDNLVTEQSELEGLQDVQNTARHFLMQQIEVSLKNLKSFF